MLNDYNIELPFNESNGIDIPAKQELIKTVSQKLRTSGFQIIKNWEAPLSDLLEEAVVKTPPFEHRGKGFCDAVILESYAEHAKNNFSDARVIVISNDDAVLRSKDRFNNKGVTVEFTNETNITETLEALLKDEIAAFNKEKNERLKEYIIGFEPQIIEYVKSQPFEITDWMINSPFTQEEDRINGSIERLISVRPIKIDKVIGGTQPYGEEELPSDKYPVQIFVELEIILVVKQFGFGIYNLKKATVQPDIVNEKSPVIFEDTTDYTPKEVTLTIKRTVTVFATLNAEKEKNNILDDFQIMKIN